MSIKNATHVYLDLCYLPEKLDGTLTLKLNSGGAGIDVEGVIDWDNATTVKIDGQTYNKVRVDFNFPPVTASTVHDMALCIVGRNTTYQGLLYIEGMTIEEAYAGTFVWSSRRAKQGNSMLRLRSGALTTASGETVAIPTQVTLVDGNASSATRSVYAYLQAVGESKDVLFGQQYNFGHKAGAANLSDSDTYDLVGDYSAVFGLDGLALAGAEFSASRCNQLYGTPFPSTAEGNVVAAAYLTNTAIQRGAIVTLSCHMPNFSQVETVTPDCAATYARYDFGTYTPNVLTGDTANEILPGGKYNEIFTAYLDMIADYANRVDGAVLFRPFHENTGSWFWWGASSCDAETYQNIYRYTVEYLRDEKNVHNFLYVYGPGSEAKTLEDYGERYPGDGYVDLVGFDMYNWAPDAESGWMEEFRQELELVSRFAEAHGKLVAVTETGVANETVEGDKQTALLRSGNKDPNWYLRVLDVVSDSPASYFLVWANFGMDNGFYTPYVMLTEGRKLYGHEMMNNFIAYYDDARSIFASDQKTVLSTLPSVTAKAAGTSSPFQDVPAGAYYVPAVQWALARRITSGTSANTFSPDSSCTRAQVMTFLWRCAGSPAPNSQDNPFQDVSEDAYYYQAVLWAVEQGITAGVSGTSFGPDATVTRGQTAMFLYRYAGSPEVSSESVFYDVAPTDYYAPAARWALEKGVTAGTSDTTFSPDSPCTRAQIVTFLYRAQQTAPV